MTVTPMNETVEGLALLDAKHRRLHPRAQVQTLRRIARRAICRADWMRELADQYEDTLDGFDDAAQASRRHLAAECRAEIPGLEHRARVALAAMLHLNVEHHLGYNVPRRIEDV